MRRKPDEIKAEKTVEQPLLEEKNNPFDEVAVEESWANFKRERKKAGASDTEKLVLGRKLEKSGEVNIKIFLESQLEMSILDKFEVDLIRHMRQELENTHIQLEREVTEQSSSRNLYTSKEKFEYMANQNPALRELKERLGLDFEY
ncbi:MAG: hypothetical protein RIC35_16110 [Marinoscillum sp.]